MQYKQGDLIKLVGHADKVFQVIKASDNNLMLVRPSNNELWSAHPDDVAEHHPSNK